VSHFYILRKFAFLCVKNPHSEVETFTTISHPVDKNQRFTLIFKALDSDWERLWLICRALCLKGIDEISLFQG